jgi:uncharacterized protein YegL
MGKERMSRPIPGGVIMQGTPFHQLGILVLDGSASMQEWMSLGRVTLAQSVSGAVRDTFSRFKQSALVNNFSFAVVYYDDTASIEIGITEAKQIDENRAYDPTVGKGGGTSIAAGLKEAKKLADTFLANYTENGIRKTVIVLILSDGLDMTESETISIANTLKSNPKIMVNTCFFETLGGDKDYMQQASDFLKGLCSDPVTGFYSGTDPEKIRSFFIASMSHKKKI